MMTWHVDVYLNLFHINLVKLHDFLYFSGYYFKIMLPSGVVILIFFFYLVLTKGLNLCLTFFRISQKKISFKFSTYFF